MADRRKTTEERGLFKVNINNALFQSENIRDVLLGDTSDVGSKAELYKLFKEQVYSHLFVDDIITETKSYIFYDVVFPRIHAQIKTCQVLLYAISHRKILDTYSKPGYYGNRSDILSQMIEETLLDEDVCKEFGIGELTLGSIDIYNSNKFYGCIMTFSVPNFR